MLTKKVAKYIQSLSHKKFRDETNSFIVEGPKVVLEFLSSKKYALMMLCTEKEWLYENEPLLNSMAPENIFETTTEALRKVSLLKNPNSVLGVFRKNLSNTQPQLKNTVSIMLDDLQDPGNMGTIIRIADWFAIENIICSKGCVDCYNPKVVQATMGSLCRVSVFYTDLLPLIQMNDGGFINIYAATLHGESVFETKKIKEGIILIGNESKGIQEKLLQLATKQITIPRIGHAESLNAAVAAGIIISHLK